MKVAAVRVMGESFVADALRFVHPVTLNQGGHFAADGHRIVYAGAAQIAIDF